MGGMIADAERARDHYRHAGRSPDVADEAVGLGSVRQERRNLSALLGRQPGLRTRRLLVPQRLTPACPRPSQPLAHRPARDAQCFRDANRLPALLGQLQRPQTPSFAPVP
jgi:hypothetical protein